MRTYITSLVTSNFQFKGNKHPSPSWAYIVVLNFYQHFHLNLFTWGSSLQHRLLDLVDSAGLGMVGASLHL